MKKPEQRLQRIRELIECSQARVHLKYPRIASVNTTKLEMTDSEFSEIEQLANVGKPHKKKRHAKAIA